MTIAGGSSRGSTAVVAVDTRAPNALAAEHVLHGLEGLLGRPVPGASTHAVVGRVVLVVDWPRPAPALTDLLAHLAGHGTPAAGVLVDDAASGPDVLVGAARAAAAAHRSRTSGRVVRFTGREAVERETTVGEVLAASTVDEVTALAGTELTTETPLDLREWARPTWRAGRAVLVVQPSADGMVPFESRDQRPCCGAH